MLTIKTQQINSIFERIVKDKNGIILHVRFVVVEVDGVFRGQIISATPLIKEEVIYLPLEKKEKIVIDNKIVFSDKIVSPYFFLEFFMSQPTRAPSMTI